MLQSTFVNGVNPFQSPDYLAYVAAGHPTSRPGVAKPVDQQDIKCVLSKRGPLTMRQISDALEADSIRVLQLLIKMHEERDVARTRVPEGNRFVWQYTTIQSVVTGWRERCLSYLAQHPARSAAQLAAALESDTVKQLLGQMESEGRLTSILKKPAGSKRPIKHYLISTTAQATYPSA